VKHLYLFGLLLTLPFFGFSQGEFNNWYFGAYAGVTFNSGVPVALTDNVIWQPLTTACMSDSAGNLLFYTNGELVYNRLHQVMPNSSGIIDDLSLNQSVMAVRMVEDDSSYYLFTMNDNWPWPPNNWGLRYSVIDMRLNGGLGDVVSDLKNISLMTPDNHPKEMTASRQQNNRDFWVIVHNSNANKNYLAYSVTQAGINPVPVQSSSIIKGPLNNYSNPGSMRVSPDGKRLVFPYRDTVEYCNFNTANGKITPLFRFGSAETGPGYAPLEFSIDSKYLYCSQSDGAPGGLYQFDATKIDSLSFVQSRILIGNALHGTWFQRGPDHKIYGTESNIDSMCVINNPSSPGTSCDFVNNVVFLSGRKCFSELPQHLERYYVYIHHTGECQWDPVNFNPTIWPQPDSVHWDFGDPASGTVNVSNFINASHIYSTPGSYTVELFVRHIDNRNDTAWQTVTVLPSPHPQLGPDRTICIGDSVIFDAGFWSGCTYQWKEIITNQIVGSGQTYTANQAGNYMVSVTGTNGCIGMDTVQLAMLPVPSITNNPLSKSICSGESTNIPLTPSVPGTSFNWTATLTSGTISGFSADSGQAINQVLINTLSTPGVVTYHITPKVGSCSGTMVDFPVTVNPGDSVKVDITASAYNVCAGTPVTFTAHPTHPGSNPVYQWKVNGVNAGTDFTMFSYTPLNNDIITCTLTSSLTVCISNNPATSNSIVMVVNPNLPVSITISPDADPVCAGLTVTFTAFPIHGGITPSYQWKVNGINSGTNSQFFTYIPLNGDLVTCTITSSETCTTNNPASSIQYPVSVSPILPVSVSITATSNPFCAGSSVTFTATPNNGGTPPSYQWKVNGLNAGTNLNTYTYNPVNNDQVYCILTSSEQCTSSNPASSITITMIQNNSLPAGVSIAPSSNPFCPGSSVTFTATPVHGGSTPSFQWKVNGNNVGINSSTYTYNPTNNDSVRCIMTSNLSCVTGNPASSAKIIMSGTLAPIVTFTSCFDTITTINAKPIRLKGGIPLGGTYSGPGVNSFTGIFNPAAAGVGTKIITYSYTNFSLCSASKSISILNLPSSILTCGNPLTDVRDNKVYQTVQIGSQCWLASNLNYGTILASSQDQRDNCIAEKYCYNDNPINCTNQGGLYQWDELMQFDETPADQGFCPPGWHIPTENDWNILFATYINSGFAGSPLKYSGYSGFNALLSGARHINKGWDFQGFATFFWSSTPRSNTQAWAHGMNDADPSVSVYPASRVNAFSVRCLKD
jgi:uncharacterized protein (TIGR02145 family)